MNPVIKSSKLLLQSDLIKLLNNEILALRIYPFANQPTCKRWQQNLKVNNQLSRYSNAKDVPVNRIGMTLFETENKPQKIKQYLAKGQLTTALIRSIFGLVNPLEHLINTLSKVWQAGCETQTIAEQPMNPGIIRSFESSLHGGLPPHVDSLLKDLPDNNEFNDMKNQLAANLYFDVSEKGGELELWNFSPNLTELESLFTGSYDFIDTTKIAVPPQKIKPKVGELILFRSNCVHAVKGSEAGDRSAASCFIGYYGQTKPLTVWA